MFEANTLEHYCLILFFYQAVLTSHVILTILKARCQARASSGPKMQKLGKKHEMSVKKIKET